MNILHVSPAFYPATNLGGPIFSTKYLCDGVSEIPEFFISVLTTNTAGSGRLNVISIPRIEEAEPLAYAVKYCRKDAGASISLGLIFNLFQSIRKHDIVHLTGTYSFPTIPTLLLSRVLSKPVVWSPRGALQATEQWAEVPNRRLKKIFETICRFVKPKNTTLLVTSTMEAEMSVSRLGDIDVEIIPNSVEIPCDPKEWSENNSGDHVALLFLSRIHEKKGLFELLKALYELPERFILNIYGVGDPGYVRTISDFVDKYSLNDRVKMHGHVDGALKDLAFLSNDIFCLPTKSENFGIAVAEALAYGLPVVTTTAAPWGGILERDCGKWIDEESDSLTAAITEVASGDMSGMGSRGRAWMIEEFSLKKISQRVADLYIRIEPSTKSGSSSS